MTPVNAFVLRGVPGLIQGVHRSWALAEDNNKINSNLGMKDKLSHPEMPSFTSTIRILDCFLCKQGPKNAYHLLLKSSFVIVILWVWPLPSNSDHQDYYIFSRESL